MAEAKFGGAFEPSAAHPGAKETDLPASVGLRDLAARSGGRPPLAGVGGSQNAVGSAPREADDAEHLGHRGRHQRDRGRAEFSDAAARSHDERWPGPGDTAP